MRKGIQAAALVFAALWFSIACNGTASRSAQPEASVSIEAKAPRGETAWPFTFEWVTNAPGTAGCRVSVFDLAERQLLQRDTRERRLASPEDLRLVLPTSRRFLWRVSVLGDNDAEIAHSELVEFEVK